MMRSFTAAEVAHLTRGRLLCGNSDTLIDNIQYDSRQAGKGSLFVPIKGEKVDAHRFIEACFRQGAAATLTEQEPPQNAKEPYILVDNTKAALQRLAAAYRQEMKVRLIGVTGSVGKTSTKEMIAAALSKGLTVMKTKGNRNSQIGLPLTMFDIEPQHDAAVIEMGMSEFGEMDRLCDIARPEMAVMTNIGKAHIENLHSQENILKEKFRITKHFTKDSTLFLNGDDPLLKTLKGKQPFHTVTFGMSPENDYYADDIIVSGFSTEFTVHYHNHAFRLQIPALGQHNITNALAAFAVGIACGLSEQTIAQGLLTYQNAPMRQQIYRCSDFVLIDDSYNASPEATKASLDVLKSIAKGKTIAVLADMLELGEAAASEHEGVGSHLAAIGIDQLIAVGELSRFTAKGAEQNGCPLVLTADSNDEAYQLLKAAICSGCTILIKGSRGMHTDEIVKKLLADQSVT